MRSSTSGSPDDTVIERSDWNGDKLDGTGESGVTLDLTQSQIFGIDFEWLGVGTIRYFVFIDGEPILLHSQHNANSNDEVYMSTPNLPVRYSIENKGAGAAASLQHICSTVISEGGQEDLGLLRYFSNEDTHVNANSSGTIYALIGVRLKTTHLDSVLKELKASVLATTNDDFEWMSILNPTVAGTFTYSDLSDSSVQTAVGVTANTVTGGTILNGGYVQGNTGSVEPLPNSLWIGSDIDGTRDELVLCARPLSANLDIYGSITWREYL